MTNQRHAYRSEVRRIIRQAIDQCECLAASLPSQTSGAANKEDEVDNDLMCAVEIITTLQTYAAMMTLSCDVEKAAFMKASGEVFDLVARCEQEDSRSHRVN